MFDSPGEAFGIGVDIENISRFRNPDIAQNPSFLNKVYTKKELAYCHSNPIPEQHLAARFAGKEAVIKALTNFTDDSVGYHDIEISIDKKGCPHARILKKGFISLHIHLSLSHTPEVALAFVVAMREHKNDSRMKEWDAL